MFSCWLPAEWWLFYSTHVACHSKVPARNQQEGSRGIGMKEGERGVKLLPAPTHVS